MVAAECAETVWLHVTEEEEEEEAKRSLCRKTAHRHGASAVVSEQRW